MADKLDFVLFGATGHTGKLILLQIHKLGKNILWGIAGRNQNKLQEALNTTAETVGENSIKNITTIIADYTDAQSIQKMTAQTKLVINCAGNYSQYGESVIQSCIESKTHYVDITYETSFLHTMFERYKQLAEDNHVYLIFACGFASIPADMGTCFMEANFNGVINSLELYQHHHRDGITSIDSAISSGTWASFITILASREFGRKHTHKFVTPTLPRRLIRKVDNRWTVPLPIIDEDIVYYSQDFFRKQYNKRPVQMLSYVVIPSLLLVFKIFILILDVILAQFKAGRNLLLRHPKFFSTGVCASPSEIDKTEEVRCTITLKCRGWDFKVPAGQDDFATPPNKEITGQISGDVSGYGFTAISTILCAKTVLTETENLPSKGGVYTPAIAFSRTSLIQQLQNNGVEFKIISVKDI